MCSLASSSVILSVFLHKPNCFHSVLCFRPGPRLDMDPDIVAALDEDFDYDDPDNMLEDDFILKANRTEGAVYAE